MDFADVVRRRHMVRRFTDEPLPEGFVERALANAHRAPSAGFTQAVEYVVLQAEQVAEFWRLTTDPGATNPWLDGMRTAPTLVLPCTSRDAYLDRYAEPDKGRSDRHPAAWPVPYWWVDGGMAVLLILQTATAEGLGACFFGIPQEHLAELRSALGVPDSHQVLGAIALGHPHPQAGSAGSPARRPRRPLNHLTHWGRWE